MSGFFDFATRSHEVFEGSVLGDEFAGSFFADAFAAGDVIDGVAGKREDIGDAIGFDVESRDDVVCSDPMGAVFGVSGFRERVEQNDAIVAVFRGDELHEVFIATGDDDVVL